jgi:hypothetical protein
MLDVIVDGRDSLLRVAAGIASGAGRIEEEWLRATGSVVLPQESGLHFNGEQCGQLALAFAAVGVSRLMALPLEEEDGFDLYRLQSTVPDLRDFSFECGSIRYLLIADGGPTRVAIVCTIDDFFLVAGPCRFVRTFANDLEAAERDFMEFVAGHFKDARPSLAPAVAYLRGEWSARRCPDLSSS